MAAEGGLQTELVQICRDGLKEVQRETWIYYCTNVMTSALNTIDIKQISVRNLSHETSMTSQRPRPKCNTA
jgi:hypothetical protein